MKTPIFLFFLLISLFLNGQEKQPKVGLVLSGGGAKGFAHIGALKEIDRAGVKLDYISGTSMGAIIGGLYAAGYSGKQIEEIVIKTDFISLLRDQIPRSSETFFEKEYGEKTAITLPVKSGIIGLPKGVSRGQNVLNLLLELLGPVSDIQDFSKLPIPFFCIATDVETGGEVVLDTGSLPLSLRASGSFPTLLNPIILNDKMLVDGGVANNFPVSIMKSKGVDVIIGVDVEGRLYEREKLSSVVSIMNQIVSYQMYSKTDAEKDKLDIYIHPEIYKFSVVDFDRKQDILQKGIDEALKYRKVFEEIAAKQIHKNKRVDKEFSAEKYLISEINTGGVNHYTRAYVLGKLKIRPGDRLSRKEITERIYLLSATKNYERIEYTLNKLDDNSYKLDFVLKENNEKESLKLGVHYDLLYKSAILANYSKKHLLLNNDLFSLDMILGDNLRYNLNYFVDNGFYISYGIRSSYNHFRANSKFRPIASQYPNISKINLQYTDFTNQIFFQTTFNRKFAIGAGLEQKHIDATTETIQINDVSTTFDNSNYYNFFGYLKLDTYDKKYFVTKGYLADLNFKWYLFSSDYNNNFKRFAQAKGKLGFATTFWNNLTFQSTQEAGFTLNKIDSEVFDFYLGGYNQNYINTFVSLYGYDFGELSGKSFLKSEFTLRYKFASKHYASFIANYARTDGNVFKDIDLFKDVKSGYALGYSYDTFIGPLEIKYSWSPDNKQHYWLFNLGFWF